jgi:hypothetical protein
MAPRDDALAWADGQELPILNQRQGTYSSIDRAVRAVVHDPGTLAMLGMGGVDVDFDSQMVLLAALGPTPSANYGIRIRRVWRDGWALRAAVEVVHPAVDAPRRGTPASPYHLVVVPRSDLNVVGFSADVRTRPLAQTR